MLTNSTSNDYEKGMPAAHTLFQVKSLALIANARKVCKSLHFLQQLVPEPHPVYRVNCDDTLRAIRDWI